MWLQVPDDVRDVLWEGSLQPDEQSLDSLQRSLPAGEPEPDLREVARNLPVVSIGQPEAWPLAAVYELDDMPQLLRSRMDEADFYLVRLACSFRPAHRATRIEWARFAVSLRPDAEGRQPIAEDLHPGEVDQEIQRRTRVTLSPGLKFQSVEASIGSAEFGLEYPELQPRIVAAGQSSTKASWDYTEVPGIAVHGGKWMHLLVRAPKGMTSAMADIYLEADVAAARGIMRVLLRSKPTDMHDHVTAALWQ
jgi:hypothetical protein